MVAAVVVMRGDDGDGDDNDDENAKHHVKPGISGRIAMSLFARALPG